MNTKNLSPLLSLIAPTYNNRENLATLVARIHKTLEGYQYELIIVDDNSPDGTAEVAKILSHQYPIKLICRKDRGGSTSAVIVGFNQAMGEIIGVMDADLQHPPEKIPELLKAIENGADIAVASRYIPDGEIDGQGTKGKAIFRGAKILARLVLPSIGNVKDPLSGFFLIKRKVIEGIVLEPDDNILLQALARGRVNEIREMPYIEEIVRQKGAPSLREQLDYLKNIFLLAAKERELRRFVKFCLVGLSGVGVNTGVFWFFTRIAGLSEPYDLVALILGIVASILSNFILNDIWTFRDRRIGSIKATLLRALKFNLISVGAIILYYAIYTPLTRFSEIYDLAALLIAIGIGLIWNFSLNVLWTWRKSEAGIVTHP